MFFVNFEHFMGHFMLSTKPRIFNISGRSLNLHLLHLIQRPNVLTRIKDILRFKNFLYLLHLTQYNFSLLNRSFHFLYQQTKKFSIYSSTHGKEILLILKFEVIKNNRLWGCLHMQS